MALPGTQYKLWDADMGVVLLHGRVRVDGSGDPDYSSPETVTPNMTWSRIGAGVYSAALTNPVPQIVDLNVLNQGDLPLVVLARPTGLGGARTLPIHFVLVGFFDGAGVGTNLQNGEVFSYTMFVVNSSTNRYPVAPDPLP